MEDNKACYTYEEVVRRSLEYFSGDELAARVWINKYALKDAEGNIYEDSPKAMHQRLAHELARIESKYANPLTEDKIFSLLDHFRYIIPAGSPMIVKVSSAFSLMPSTFPSSVIVTESANRIFLCVSFFMFANSQ